MVSANARLVGLAARGGEFTDPVTTICINTAWVQLPHLEAGETINQCRVFDGTGHKSKGP